MFFTIIGFAVCFGLTFGTAAFILWQGYWMSKPNGPYPLGALISAAIFIGLGICVVVYAPFHIALTP